MRHAVACTILVCLPAAAPAEPVGSVDLGTTFVSGPVTPGAWNPSLRMGLGATAGVRADRTDLRVSWSVYRDQAFCDTCGVGRELLGSSDLQGSVGRRFDLGPASLRVATDLVLPASRDAFACNPFHGAPGVSATVSVPVSASTIRASGRAARPFYRYDAVPVGLCEPPLDGVAVDTLSGPAAPTPWGGARPGSPNPTATGALALAWADPHALLFDGRLTSGLSLGVDASRQASPDAVSVTTASGTVRLDDGAAPFVVGFPWSISAGVAAAAHLDLSLALSDRVPALLADPGGTLRATPGRTALTFTVSGHL